MSWYWKRYRQAHEGHDSLEVEGQNFRFIPGQGQPVMGPTSEDDPYGIDPKVQPICNANDEAPSIDAEGAVNAEKDDVT